MFISISEAKGRFTFLVGEDPNDDPRAHFWSLSDAHLVNGMSQDYASFGEAHVNATKLAENRQFHVMAKRVVFHKHSQDYFEQFLNPKDTSVAHFEELLDLVEARLDGIETLDDIDRVQHAEAITNELDGISGDIEALMKLADDDEMRRGLEEALERAREIGSDKRIAKSLAKKAQANVCKHRILRESMVEMGEAAFMVLQPIHPKAFLKRIASLDPQGLFEISIAESTDAGIVDLVGLRLEASRDPFKDYDQILLLDVIPGTGIARTCPLHSRKFYSNYWKPIVTAIGHIAPPGHGIMAVASPGFRDTMPGWNLTTGKPAYVSAVFSGDDKQFWKLSSGDTNEPVSKFTEGELKEGEEVKCINRAFPSYFGRTGTVVGVVPRHDYADVTVDFRRGLGKVVLTDRDLERVVLP